MRSTPYVEQNKLMCFWYICGKSIAKYLFYIINIYAHVPLEKYKKKNLDHIANLSCHVVCCDINLTIYNFNSIIKQFNVWHHYNAIFFFFRKYSIV